MSFNFGKSILSIAIILLLISCNVYAGLTDGLLTYYSFDDDSDDVVTDSSGNGNHGTAYNDFEYVDGVDGEFSNAIRLVGSGHTGYGGGHVLFPFIALNEIPAFTISMWVNHENSTTWGGNAFIEFGGSTDPVGGGYWVSIRYGTDFPNSNLNFFVGGSGVGGNVSVPYTPGLVNNWNHLALRADNGTLTAFLNGQSLGSDTYQLGVMQPTAGLGVDWFNSGGTESTRFTGSIDDVGIWNRALSEEEIQYVYVNPIPEPATLLLFGLGGLLLRRKRRA